MSNKITASRSQDGTKLHLIHQAQFWYPASCALPTFTSWRGPTSREMGGDGHIQVTRRAEEDRREGKEAKTRRMKGKG